MVIENDIAEWYFEDQSHRFTQYGMPETNRLLEVCEKCLPVLIEQRLLLPTKVAFDKSWRKFSSEHNCFKNFNNPGVSLDLDENCGSFHELCINKIQEQQSVNGEIFPTSLYITGSGIIYDENGKEELWENVVGIQSEIYHVHTITLTTKSYAWLPFTLKGKTATKNI
ncbi:hypothetical protein [Zooshikella ganghwensis]|uniref:Uncharacterized protein n=1 Tax=Zooshikella ganghwensis TaxID=202772 RepID=A0A4P9VFG0_9GAMM|nr:hypothetical protein [Zooshikella ganghwensis]RDH41838.1 hypothetical protein B9G39_26815 [Zooshikella ganghwensis]